MANSLSPNFFIKNFTIHVVESASCVNIGSNHPTGFTSFKKHNQGFGSVNGSHNTLDGIKTLLSDKSLFDMFHNTDDEDAIWINEIKDLVFSKVDAYLETADVVEEEGDDAFINIDDELEFIDELEKIGMYDDEEIDNIEYEEENEHNDEENEDMREMTEEDFTSVINDLVSRVLKEIMPKVNVGVAQTENLSEQQISNNNLKS
ncbi:hypothetical protein [Lederbergia citri]|uniref:Uncharacterized protein n=1 Tax=Lederbergia citri TaxID=2833580 RepID=A0A942TCF8_9BACI|nr:hypothetical protein [Lederbergia citri]MBS4193739.1 hypothetical protein [Lederbergia citri]